MYRLGSAAPLVIALTAGGAHAQVTAPNAPVKIEEVVVTAEKRDESVQEVPLSIVAVSAEALENVGVTNASELGKLVPALQTNNGLFGAGVTIRIRGFGSPANSATDSEVAAYIDSAFVARPGAVLSSFLDVKSVEVLSGPQGTLFGRNATMGAISINTNSPSTTERTLEAKAELGKYGTYSGTAIGNLPINDQLAIRFALKGTHTDGVYNNNLDGKTYGESTGTVGRLSAKWDVGPDVTWIVRLDDAESSGDGAYPVAVYTDTASSAQLTAFTGFITRNGGSPPVYSSPPSYSFNQVFSQPYENDRQYGITSDVSWNLSPILTARLIDTYRNWTNRQLAGDTIATSLNLLAVAEAFNSKAQSHELQLISPKGAFLGSKLGFTSGLYYFHEDYTLGTGFNIGSQFCAVVLARAPAAIPGCLAAPQVNAASAAFNQATDSYAGYFQVNYQLLPSVDLDVGARQTWDRKSGAETSVTPNSAFGSVVQPEGPDALGFNDSKPSERVSLSWHLSDKIMAFGTFATGYKSGGFNSGPASPALNSALRTFNSETVKDYEVGVKSIFGDGKFLLNATLFDTELHNFQDRSFNGTAFVIRNSGDVRSRGLDLDGQVLALSDLKLTYGVTYLDSFYTYNPNAPGLEGCTGLPGCPTTQDLAGKPLGYAPKWNGNVAAQWNSSEFMGGYTVQLAATENFTKSFLTSNTDNPQSQVPGHATTDLRISFYTPDAKWQLDLFGQNIFDKRYYVATVAQVLGAAMGINDTSTGATIFRGFLGDPARFGVRLSAKF